MAENLPDLDLSFLYEIADGSDEFIVDSIGMFLEQTPQLIELIDSAINAHDWSSAASAAHKLKPNLGFFGMTGGQTMMQEIEAFAKTGIDMDALKAKYDEANGIVTSCLAPLQRIKAEKEAEL